MPELGTFQTIRREHNPVLAFLAMVVCGIIGFWPALLSFSVGCQYLTGSIAHAFASSELWVRAWGALVLVAGLTPLMVAVAAFAAMIFGASLRSLAIGVALAIAACLASVVLLDADLLVFKQSPLADFGRCPRIDF